MKILLTGGAGYIGSHTVMESLREGHDLLVVDNFSNSEEKTLERIRRHTNRNFLSVEADVRDRKALCDIFSSFVPDVVIHFAGLKAVGESGEIPEDYYSVNVGGSLNVIEAMKSVDCCKICFSSSATVYGDPEFLPITEDHLLRVTNPYGRSKLQVEDILRDVGRAHRDWAVAILRYFNPVGASSSGIIGEDPKGIPGNLMPYVAQVATGQRPYLNIFGDDYDTADGTGIRDYIHVEDLAKAHLGAARWLLNERGVREFNLGMGKGTSVLEMVRIFAEQSGRNIPIRVVPRREGDIACCYADPSRAEAEFGWKATKSIEEMCRSAWEWQSKHERY